MSLPNSIDAPYNFVPLSDWVHTPDWGWQVSHDLPFRDGLSGHLDLLITAHSPILVGRDRRRGEEPSDDHPGQVHPFQLPDPDGRYAIPGTALKGMIRNVVEIASFSRMGMVDDRRLAIRDLTPGARPIYGSRMTETSGPNTYRPLSKAGWLKFDDSRNGWLIEPCEFARVERSDLLAYHHAPWVNIQQRPTAEGKYRAWTKPLTLGFTPGPEQTHGHSQGRFLVYRKASQLGSGAVDGTLVFTGQPSPRKHMEFIFFGSTGAPIPVPDPVFRGFLDIHDQRTENGPQTPWEYWKTRPKVPVFYLEQPGRSGTVASLGLALMYKLAYSHSIHDAIRNSHPDHLNEAKDDLATLIFGRVGDSPAACLKGRVALQHAIAQDSPEPEVRDPTILNGPKPTYYPNYIRQPRAQANRIPAQQGYSTFMEPGCEIRGWKRYPARLAEQAQPQTLTAEQLGNPAVQTRLHPLPVGTRFASRLTFHNLRPVELGSLCWALTWGGAQDLRHGLGMGKPFGFGQVAVAIEGAEVHPNASTVGTPRWEECMDSFVVYMDQAHRIHSTGGGRWRDCDQIRTLLGMADPNQKPPSGSRLRHMSLTTDDQNEFKDAKVARLVLPDYPKANHPPTWGEREVERQAEEQERQRETEALAEAARAREEEARAQAAFDAKPEEEKYLILARREIDAFLLLDEGDRRSKQRREDLSRCLNGLFDTACRWSDPGWRNAVAQYVEQTYGDPRVGWGDPGADRKKREKQEEKRRKRIAELRAGLSVPGQAPSSPN